jgi:hypothetical protein
MTDVLEILSGVDKRQLQQELARRDFAAFIAYTYPAYDFNWHHKLICEKLNRFAKGEIKKMMIFVPPQHGKSELATRRFPAFQLGVKPKTKIAICSYSDTLSSSFNRDIQRIIDDQPYYEIFPDTYLNESNVSTDAHGSYLRNASIFETVGHRGFVKTVGVGGSLTGTPVDLGIVDDPFKDREEASSVRIRDKVWSWYTDVFRTRLHNQSQELIIMTRWDEDDLAGRLLKRETDWEVIVFQGIKRREMPGDPRKMGEALWPNKHSLERLEAVEADSPITFNSLYQQEPKAPKELLVFPEWSEIDTMPDLPYNFGIDFGNPFAVVKVAVHNKNIYLDEILYDRSNPTNTEVVNKLRSFGIDIRQRFACDSAEPRSIKDLRSAGLNATEAVKGQGSILSGIKKINDFKIHVTKTSHNLKLELNNYQYESFKGESTGEPIDDWNHLIDAVRYVILTFLNKARSSGGATAF